MLRLIVLLDPPDVQLVDRHPDVIPEEIWVILGVHLLHLYAKAAKQAQIMMLPPLCFAIGMLVSVIQVNFCFISPQNRGYK